MDFNNKTILIIGLVCGGLFSLYLHNEQLASVIFGGLIGYLSKDTIKLETDEPMEDDSDNGSDDSIA